MLLTNTINASTINTIVATGNVNVFGIELRGCSARPDHYLSGQPSGLPIGKRESERSLRSLVRLPLATREKQSMSWPSPWQRSSMLSQAGSAWRSGSIQSFSLN